MLNRLLVYPFLILILAFMGIAHAQTDDAALAAFKNLDNYLQNNPLDFESTFDASSDGNDLYHGKAHFIVRQPNDLRAEITLENSTYLVISDGTILTIYDPQQKKYSQTASPSSISAAFSFFTGELGIDAQVVNFMDVVHAVVSGGAGLAVKSEGTETLEGKTCDKFAVGTAGNTDTWQAWLEKGEKPLLCKLVYHSVDGPSQTNNFTWSGAPEVTATTFTFSPPAGSTKVDVGDLNMVTP
jgi:hypothetical protein